MRIPFLAFLFLFLIRSLFAAVEKPFNFNETPGKLPKEVVPTEYQSESFRTSTISPSQEVKA